MATVEEHYGDAGHSADPQPLEALLDKLVAARMDLKQVGSLGRERIPIVAALVSVAGACDVLDSAVADLRNIIKRLDGVQGSDEYLGRRRPPRLAMASNYR
jgi:hypothetical protein